MERYRGRQARGEVKRSPRAMIDPSIRHPHAAPVYGARASHEPQALPAAVQCRGRPRLRRRDDEAVGHRFELLEVRPELLVQQVVIPQLHPEMWENVADATRFRARVIDRL